MSGVDRKGRCPVCRARFRGTAECSRCGADLSALMRIAARAWHLRNASRAALIAEQYERASTLAQASRVLQDLPATRRLETIARRLSLGLRAPRLPEE